MNKILFNFLVVTSAYFSATLGAGAFGGTGGGAIGATLCEVVYWLDGPIGAAIASFAVIFLGIGAFFGKVTWGTALLTAVGVFTIFGSQAILLGLGMPAC